MRLNQSALGIAGLIWSAAYQLTKEAQPHYENLIPC